MYTIGKVKLHVYMYTVGKVKLHVYMYTVGKVKYAIVYIMVFLVLHCTVKYNEALATCMNISTIHTLLVVLSISHYEPQSTITNVCCVLFLCFKVLCSFVAR